MAATLRTQVGIVGAGPAGLLLSHLLALAGIDSVVVENRSREYCESRQRAGLLEAGTVELLRSVGLGKRLDTEGIEHDGIYLQFSGCLLYTSDAADDLLCVDLGGRRISK